MNITDFTIDSSQVRTLCSYAYQKELGELGILPLASSNRDDSESSDSHNPDIAFKSQSIESSTPRKPNKKLDFSTTPKSLLRER